MWAHLAGIRALQSEVAQMHVAMERLGEKQDRDQAAAEDEFAPFAEKERQEREFDGLAMRFKERREGIENIMKKARHV